MLFSARPHSNCLRFAIIVSLVVLSPSEAVCLRETLVSLAQKISGRPGSAEPFQKYFEGGDPAGWKKIIDEEVATTNREVSLGGNSGGVNVVTLVGGSTVVTKSFPSDPLEHQAKIIDQMERWRDEGRGPEIIGVSLLPGNRRSERRLFIVMEDLLGARNKYGTRVVAGSGKKLHASEGSQKLRRSGWRIECSPFWIPTQILIL
ncbi:MAG: hypothetical protein EBQ92_13965 [Proteobacteria bacterium]|nr:hypothetical protein [Pseudomonadota bacterium]